jgi:DNA/RNA-binding domain of Phe-tRNA-synthetase-like protein
MQIAVDPKIFDEFDNPRIGITVVKNADNGVHLDLSEEFSVLATEMEKEYGGQTISVIPKIAAWREAYRQFGSKPADYPSSIESLLKRVSKGGSFWGISPLVDIYNYISLKHLMPAGGEDTSKISGDIELTYANANEKAVTVLGKDKEESPKEGEVIYKDLEGTICRRWNWREVARTVLTDETKNCVIVFEALNPVSDEELGQAQDELGELLEKYCGAQIQHHVLTANNPNVAV